MNERQSFILNALVTEYVKTAKPVGSSALLRSTDLDVSPATVRNDMKQLEEEGFLAQPHTSAGRVPTDTGYREYVNSLLAHRRRAQQYNERLAQELTEAREREKFLSLALAHVLARRSGAVGVSQSDEKLRSTHQGFASLLEAPEFRDSKSVAGVARTLEKIDEILGEYVDDVALHEGALSPRAVVISIGQENPVEELRSCALLMSPYEDAATGQRGVIALLGPTRMAYQQNISLLEQVRSVLGSRGAMMGAGMLLIISIV